jgi:glycosyltransferase involved in cell wall biosynthesis
MKTNIPADSPHVLMVVNTYAPDDPRVIYSAASLVKMGYAVRLIGAARRLEKPVPARQQIDGVDVWVTPVITAQNALSGFMQSLIQIFRADLHQPITQFHRGKSGILSLLLFSLWVLRLGLFGPRLDVIHCHDLSPLAACWVLARLKRARLIYDIHENVPTMYAGRKGAVMTRLERFLVKRVDYVVAAGERLAEAMPERGAKQVMHIGNWKRLSEYALDDAALDQLRQRWNLPPDALIVSHIGTLDSNRELPPLLEAVSQRPDVHLLIGGHGGDAEKAIQAAENFPNIHWLGWVPLVEIPAYTLISDVIYYCRSPQHYGGSYELAPAPNKLYEAFAAGRPLIVRRGVGEVGAILARIPAGILLDDVNAETIQAAFDQLRDPLTRERLQAAAHEARKRYHWGVAETRLQDVYTALLKRP